MARFISVVVRRNISTRPLLSIDLIAKVAEATGGTKGEDIIKYWNMLSHYPGYFGNYTFSPTQHNGYLTEEVVMSEASSAKNGTFALAPGYK